MKKLTLALICTFNMLLLAGCATLHSPILKYNFKDFEALLKSAKAELEPLFDVEDTQSESRLFYRYEIFDVENKPIILEHSHELLNDSGGVL